MYKVEKYKHMNLPYRNAVFFMIVIAIFDMAANGVCQDAGVQPEYSVKAAFLYNFIRFTNWPDSVVRSEPDKHIIIGVLGENPFGSSTFETVEKKRIPGKGKKLIVKYLGGYGPNVNLNQCNVIFVCSSESDKFRQIIKAVSGSHIMTVGDSPGFIKSGGMINFVIKDNKVRWEINDAAVKLTRLKLSSQLYRSAVKVVCEEKGEGYADGA